MKTFLKYIRTATLGVALLAALSLPFIPAHKDGGRGLGGRVVRQFQAVPQIQLADGQETHGRTLAA